jgi:hypothetical protein
MSQDSVARQYRCLDASISVRFHNNHHHIVDPRNNHFLCHDTAFEFVKGGSREVWGGKGRFR